MDENRPDNDVRETTNYEPAHMKKTKAQEWMDTFTSTTNFMKKVFLVAVVVCFGAVFVMFCVSRDHTTQADRNKAFVMNPESTAEFTVDTGQGIADFRLVGMREEKCETPDCVRVLLTYEYRVKKGTVDLCRIAFAASYIGDGENPFMLSIIPIGASNNDLSELKDVPASEDYATANLLLELPKTTGLIYSDIGGSMSVSGRPSWIVYRVGDVINKDKLGE